MLGTAWYWSQQGQGNRHTDTASKGQSEANRQMESIHRPHYRRKCLCPPQALPPPALAACFAPEGGGLILHSECLGPARHAHLRRPHGPEVHQHGADAIAVQQHVLGLDVAVGERGAAVVQLLDPLEHALEQPKDRRLAPLAATPWPIQTSKRAYTLSGIL